MIQFRVIRRDNLFLLIGLFVILDCSVLGLNILLSRELEQDAIEINVAGWQRMLSQSISKNVYALGSIPLNRGRHQKSKRKENIVSDMESFRRTLHAFKYGGITLNPRGEQVYLRKAAGVEKLRVINYAEKAWASLNGRIDVYFSNKKESEASLEKIIKEAEKNNVVMLVKMNQLVDLLEGESIRKSELIRIFQVMAFILALANFGYIVKNYTYIIKNKDKNLERLNRVIQSVGSAVVILKESRVVSYNRAAKSMFSIKSIEHIDSLIRAIVFIGPNKDGKYLYYREEGVVYLDLDRRKIKVCDNSLEVITINDISEYVKQEHLLSSLAYVDPLTNISNRAVIDDHLEHELKRSKRNNLEFSILYIDLDGFKLVNDSLGHDVGDQLLIKVSRLMQNFCRECDTVGRVGGDEFIIILPDTPYDAAVKLGIKLTGKIKSMRETTCKTVNIGASIGVATFPKDGESIAQLKVSADQSMYEIKRMHHQSLEGTHS